MGKFVTNIVKWTAIAAVGFICGVTIAEKNERKEAITVKAEES